MFLYTCIKAEYQSDAVYSSRQGSKPREASERKVIEGALHAHHTPHTARGGSTFPPGMIASVSATSNSSPAGTLFSKLLTRSTLAALALHPYPAFMIPFARARTGATSSSIGFPLGFGRPPLFGCVGGWCFLGCLSVYVR